MVIMLANIADSFRLSGTVGQCIVFFLFLFSIISWSIMCHKMVALKRGRTATRRFLHAFRNQSNPLSLYLKGTLEHDSPLTDIYIPCCNLLGQQLERIGTTQTDLFRGGDQDRPLTPARLRAIRDLAERNVADGILILEKNVGYLATASATAPLIGLFGTVWGVMQAFNGMASAGSAHLAAVMPGISAALLTTVVGLFVAIPSAIGYNIIANSIRTQSVEMDNFAQELIAALERDFAQE